jgi:hypothetical protein
MKSQVTVEEWVARFRAIGLDEAAMEKWHTLFERENPAGHQSFLEWLGLSPARIAEIRKKSA